MKNRIGYSSWFSDEVVAFTYSLSKVKRRKIIDLADTIATHPFRLSDYQFTDEVGHIIENIMVDEFIFSYWVDHAVKKLRITEIVMP
jgi:hypothetical protein